MFSRRIYGEGLGDALGVDFFGDDLGTGPFLRVEVTGFKGLTIGGGIME